MSKLTSKKIKELMDAMVEDSEQAIKVEKRVDALHVANSIALKKELLLNLKQEHLLHRLQRCSSEEEFLDEFALDSLKQMLYEMKFAASSKTRLAASKEFYQRARGKVPDKVLSIGAQVSGANEKEIDGQIDKLLNELGYAKEEGKASSALVVPKREERSEPVERLSTESGISGELLPESGEE